LKHNLNKVDWKELSYNENALSIIEQNLDKVIWYCLSKNPNATHLLINYKYNDIKKRLYSTFGKELMETLYHPLNAHKWEGWMV
ncbi:MAG: hypothetical protein ACKPKO_27605, partial [Candidatus Fonsibacter sp.]